MSYDSWCTWNALLKKLFFDTPVPSVGALRGNPCSKSDDTTKLTMVNLPQFNSLLESSSYQCCEILLSTDPIELFLGFLSLCRDVQRLCTYTVQCLFICIPVLTKNGQNAYFKEPFLTHLISLKRVQGTRLIRIFCARNNMRTFLSDRYLSYNLSSKMTISHSRLAGTEIFETMNMPEIFEISSLTHKNALNPNRKKDFDENLYWWRQIFSISLLFFPCQNFAFLVFLSIKKRGVFPIFPISIQRKRHWTVPSPNGWVHVYSYFHHEGVIELLRSRFFSWFWTRGRSPRSWIHWKRNQGTEKIYAQVVNIAYNFSEEGLKRCYSPAREIG